MTASDRPEQNRNLSGSFHPFNTPVINPALHEKISRVRQGASFVGSLSGTTGYDESVADDYVTGQSEREMTRRGQSFAGSFRDQGTSVGGPRSLSERMRLEEFMEEKNRDGVR